jgi:hypothetical protein
VALVRTDVSEELSVSLIRVTRIGELGTTLAVFLQEPHGITSQKSPFFIIPFYLQSVPVHVANCAETYPMAYKRLLSSALQGQLWLFGMRLTN